MIPRKATFANCCGRFSETSEHLGSRDRQVFSRSDVKRDTVPTPGVNLKFYNRKRFGLGAGIYSWFFAIIAELPPNDVIRCERRNGLQDFGLFIANRLTVVPDGRFHAEVAEHLEHMILDHVPHSSVRIVECASTLVICTLSMWVRFQKGSMNSFANLKISMLRTGPFPR